MLDLLFLAIAPAVFIFLYIYAKDRYEPEPLHLVLWIFFLGCLCTIPAGIVEVFFPEDIVTSSVVAPVVEETAKFLVVFLFVYRHAEFDEPMDGIVYATAAALGFATVENIFYVLDGGLAVGILRALLSVPGHVIFSCIWGAALGIAKFRPKEQETGIILTGLFGAILLHGIFNFSIEAFEGWGLLILIVLVPAGIWWTNRNIRCAMDDPASACSMQARAAAAARAGAGFAGSVVTEASRASPEIPHVFCTECGAALTKGKLFCENCGKKVE
ncbi:MAG: PrsW family intramembrane metalloprotease [Methanomicrobiales archaeon]|nr:PrsW family intramembrane metalloprotease [Methanomicrobiales archaeon]